MVPLCPSAVARYLRDHLTGNRRFIVAGSYPSAVLYHRENHECLEYNDIDVYVEAEEEESGFGRSYDLVVPDSRTLIVIASVESANIEGTPVQLNIIKVSVLDLHLLIDGFDINAIQVGFESTELATLEWYRHAEFEEFLLTKRLKLSDITNDRIAPGSAFVRLLYKAQQLGLEYTLPDEQVLLETVDQRCFKEKTKNKLDSLSPELQEEVYRRFHVNEVLLWWNRVGIRFEGFKFDRKHTPASAWARALVEDVFGFGDDSSIEPADVSPYFL